MLWGGHTPADCTRWINSSGRKRCSGARRWQTGTDQSLDSPSSPCSHATDARSVYRPSSSLLWWGWNEAVGEAAAVSYYKGRGWGSFRGEGKAEFWQLEFSRRKNKISPSSLWNVPTQWKWKSVNSKDKCYHSSLSVRTSHMWFPWTDLPPKPWPKLREKLSKCRT